jgi:tetratricopeptide (TPR) repeat protein
VPQPGPSGNGFDAKIARDGAQAVALAERAVRLTGGRQPAVLDALAAAYAEAGRFSEAVDIAGQALQLARSQANPRLVGCIIRASVSLRHPTKHPHLVTLRENYDGYSRLLICSPVYRGAPRQPGFGVYRLPHYYQTP